LEHKEKKASLTDRGYSLDVAEILDRKPNWLVRRGTVLAAIIFAAGLLASWFIPYPERLPCEITFDATALNSAGSGPLSGVIRLPEKQAALIAREAEVRVILPASDGNPVTIPGVVTEMARDTIGSYWNVMVLLSQFPSEGRAKIASGRAGAQIVTGKSNLLTQVFKPVVSVISGTNSIK
jgi:hypothetical protein